MLTTWALRNNGVNIVLDKNLNKCVVYMKLLQSDRRPPGLFQYTQIVCSGIGASISRIIYTSFKLINAVVAYTVTRAIGNVPV